jgi:hypothetical protein
MLLLLAALAPALAAPVSADVTTLPPPVRGDLRLTYDLAAESAAFREGTRTDLGRRNIAAHTLTWMGQFSPVTGLGLSVEVPHIVAEGVRYRDVGTMTFDPNADGGTLSTAAGRSSPDGLSGEGVGGVWLAVQGLPLSESAFAARGDRASALLDVGYRFRDATNFWTVTDGVRGAGPGASAFRLGAAFSTTRGPARPFVTTRWVRTVALSTDLVDDAGRTLARGVEILPATTLDLTAGTEITGATWGDDGARLDVDLRARVGYRSWQDIPSGTYLPSILDASRGLVVNEGEGLSATGAAGLRVRFHEVVQLDVSGECGVASSRRVEHIYPVSTRAGALVWGVQTALRFRVRDNLWAQPGPAALPVAPRPAIGG